MADNINLNDPQVQKIIKAFMKSVGGASYDHGGYASYKSKDESGVDVRKLKNLMSNNSNYLEHMGNMYKKMLLSSKKLDDVFNVLEKSSRALDKKQRQTMLSVVETLKDFKKQGKEVTEGFEKINKTLSKSKDAYGQIDKLAASVKRLNDLQSDRTDIEVKLKKAQKSKGKNSPEAKELQDKYDALNEMVASEIKARAKARNSLTTNMKDVTEALKDYNAIAQVLTDQELDYLKNLKNINAADTKYIEIIKKLAESQSLLTEANQTAADVMAARSQRAAESFEGAVHSLKQSVLTAGKLLLTRGVPIAFNDFMNRMKYNIPESNYGGSLTMGIAESERSQLIGENRTNLRAMGNGNEYKGFDKGLNSLQNTAYQFGVYGKDALQLALAYQKTGMNLGISGNNSTGQKMQMTQMHLMSEQIGVTDDALKDFYDSLSDMGQIASLYGKYSDKTESERTKSINKEIYERTKLNIALGVSLDLQKQQQQEAVNKRYSGIESLIKSQIGAQMQVDNFNSTNTTGKISEKDKAFYAQTYAAGGAGVLTNQNDIKRYTDISQKMAMSDNTRLAKAQQSAAGGNFNPMYRESIATQILSSLNVDRQKFDNENGKSAILRGSYNNQNVTGNKTFDALISEASSKFNGPDGFTKSVIDATQALHGLIKNPAGDSAGALFDGIKGFVLKGVADKWLGPVFAQLAGKKGIAGVLGKAGSWAFGGGAASTVAGSLSTRAMLTGGLKWGARGLAGAAGAWGINKLFGGSDTLSAGNNDLGSQALRGSDNIADLAMGSGFVPAMAVGGAWKGGTRIGNAAYNQLSKSDNFNKMSDIAFGSTFGLANSLFNGDDSGLNLAKSDTIDLSNKFRGMFGLSKWDSDSLPTWLTSGTSYAPSQAISNHASEQDKQDAERDQDEVKDHLAKIAKNTQATSDELKKQTAKDEQNPENAPGNLYAFYNNHLQSKLNGLS